MCKFYKYKSRRLIDILFQGKLGPEVSFVLTLISDSVEFTCHSGNGSREIETLFELKVTSYVTTLIFISYFTIYF